MTQEKIQIPISNEQLQKLLPHRYPMLMLDRIVEFEEGKGLVGYKNVAANEPFFAGHFPERPIMPGVLILEALAQAAAVYALLCSGAETSVDKLLVFSGAESVRFRRQVVPGDILRLELGQPKSRSGHWQMHGVAFVENDKAAEAVVKATEVS